MGLSKVTQKSKSFKLTKDIRALGQTDPKGLTQPATARVHKVTAIAVMYSDTYRPLEKQDV